MLAAIREGHGLAAGFVPQRYIGRMVFFQACDAQPGPPIASWAPYIDGDIRVVKVSSAHERMLEHAPAATIGAALARELDALHAAPATTEARSERKSNKAPNSNKHATGRPSPTASRVKD